MTTIYYNRQNEQQPYQSKAADILLERMKTSQPCDVLNIVLAFKELFAPTYDGLEINTGETATEPTNE